MLLHQLNDRIPLLGSGVIPPKFTLAAYAQALLSELEWLNRHPVTLTVQSVLPLDFFCLFPLHHWEHIGQNGAIEFDDWLQAAVIRLAEALTGTAPVFRHANGHERSFELRLAKIGVHAIVRHGSGPAELIRKVLHCSQPPPLNEVRRLLSEKLIFAGMQLQEIIGRGSTSIAYRVVGKHRPCVLKLPVPEQIGRFRREVELARTLKHRNSPEILEFSLEDPTYCVLEPLHTGAAVKTAPGRAGFLRALKYLHSRNILHGDIRLANLGLSWNGLPMLFDFSHARQGFDAEFARAAGAEVTKMQCLWAQ